MYIPALAHASFLDTDRTRNARAPTRPRSTGLCAIWDCITQLEFEFLFFLALPLTNLFAFAAPGLRKWAAMKKSGRVWDFGSQK